MAWLASDFLAEVRQAAALAASNTYAPEGQKDADILRLADRELQTALLPLMLGVREEWFVIKKSVAFTASVKRVRVPARSIAGRLRDVRCTIGNVDTPLVRLQTTDKPWIQPQPTTGPAYGYYLEGEWVVFLPPPQQGGTLDLYYLARPGRLTITPDDYRVITAVDAAGVPGATAFATWTYCDGTKLVDFVRGSSGLGPLQQDVSAVETGATNDEFTVSTEASGFIEVGDYITKPDLTPVVPLPVELHGALVARVTAALHRQNQKMPQADMEEGNARRIEDKAVQLLTKRVESANMPARGKLMWRRTRVLPWGW